jgi:hypothetical protein
MMWIRGYFDGITAKCLYMSYERRIALPVFNCL